jgi:hypothetical protein
MWLPELAVDDETLDVLAAEGVRFTILSPTQAESVRELGGDWAAADPERLDPKTPYVWTSPVDPSRTLAIFFYHGRLSRGVEQGDTIASAPVFAGAVRGRLMPGDAAQMVHVASDGEFYGHHHAGAEQTLALGLDILDSAGIPNINHARFLKLFPPPRAVRVRARTSWSCPHGLGRWLDNCGCKTATIGESSQAWRGPLRDALDGLARRVDEIFESQGKALFHDPWSARDGAHGLGPAIGAKDADALLQLHASRTFIGEERSVALKLLALQRERLAMFTSCGWFFDDVSGIETIYLLQRAARVVDLARQLGHELEAELMAALARARSNLDFIGDGAEAYRRLAAPTRVDLRRAAAHAAILDDLGLPTGRPTPALTFKLDGSSRADKPGKAGRQRSLSARRVFVERPETGESGAWRAVVHRGDRLDFACWLLPLNQEFDVATLAADFHALDDDAFRSQLDALWGLSSFGLDAVFSDDRAEIAKALAPEGGLGPERALFLRKWTAAIAVARRGGRSDDALLEMLAKARELSFPPEQLPWAHTLEEDLHIRLEEALHPGGPAELSRAYRWLDALWDSGLLAGRWRLRDFHARWATKVSRAPASAEKDACRALGARLGLAEALLEDASW